LKQLSAPDDFWDKTDALLSEKETGDNPGAAVSRMNGWHLISRIAAVLLLTLGGFWAGTWYANNNSNIENATKTNVLAAKFEQASASERIKLIQTEYDKSSENAGIEQVLIQALNNDDNVNVRLAAAGALFHFRSDPNVRKALIRALPSQTDPNVQIALIDLLVKLHERKAVPEMRVMLLKNDLNPVVRYKLEDGLGSLS
jgi:flagellar basal body-associated protein FliL